VWPVGHGLLTRSRGLCLQSETVVVILISLSGFYLTQSGIKSLSVSNLVCNMLCEMRKKHTSGRKFTTKWKHSSVTCLCSSENNTLFFTCNISLSLYSGLSLA
jgi:hypothetical protein